MTVAGMPHSLPCPIMHTRHVPKGLMLPGQSQTYISGQVFPLTLSLQCNRRQTSWQVALMALSS